MNTPDRLPTPATSPRPRFGDHALNLDIYSACFAAVRRAFPLREGAAATVYIDHEAIDAWLKATPTTLTGRLDGDR